MAKVKKNVVVNGLSGILADQVVVKQDTAGRTLVTVKPTLPEEGKWIPPHAFAGAGIPRE